MISADEVTLHLSNDIKLWEGAETTYVDGNTVKTLILPHGIGEVAVTLEGMNDATARRNAVAAFAGYIRERVKEATDDDLITAKAQAQAARVREENDRAARERGTIAERKETVVDQAPVPTFAEAFDLGAGLGDRILQLRGRIKQLESELRTANTTLRAYSAAQQIMEEANVHINDPGEDAEGEPSSAGGEAPPA